MCSALIHSYMYKYPLHVQCIYCIVHIHVYSTLYIHTHLFPHAVDPSLFPHKPIVPRAARKTESSVLAQLLDEYDKRSANPFFEYSRFNGDVSYIDLLLVCFYV